MFFRVATRIIVILALTCAFGTRGEAKVLIVVDKSSQQMSVSVDGVPRYQFTVSTGRKGYSTPNGTFHPERMATTWFSKIYYNSPMPHSIFFHGGFAIHGSYEINRLGGPASHGCIRLHPDNAAALFSLVQAEGVAATTIVVSGSNLAPSLSRPSRSKIRFGKQARGQPIYFPPPYQLEPQRRFWYQSY
jgi:L,D-transpeptidase catalytic domain